MEMYWCRAAVDCVYYAAGGAIAAGGTIAAGGAIAAVISRTLATFSLQL